jgi:hypothetical protein
MSAQLARLAERKGFRPISFGDYLLAGLSITGWIASTLLTTAGLFVALFFAAGNLTVAGFFEQVALLSTRYGEVEPVVRAPFDQKLMTAFAIVFGATAFFRRASLISIFKTGGVDGPGTDART